MFTIKAKINPTARQKLRKVSTTVYRLGIWLASQGEHLRNELAQELEMVYPLSTELRTLMMGFAESPSRFTGGQIGTTEGGRLDYSSFKPLPEIIRGARIKVRHTKNMMSLEIGSLSRLNNDARFDYYRKDGQKYTANPFDGLYVQSVNDGGVWHVRPRSDSRTNMLYPEDGVLIKAMKKEVSPKNFISNVRNREKIKMSKKIMQIMAQGSLVGR